MITNQKCTAKAIDGACKVSLAKNQSIYKVSIRMSSNSIIHGFKVLNAISWYFEQVPHTLYKLYVQLFSIKLAVQ